MLFLVLKDQRGFMTGQEVVNAIVKRENSEHACGAVLTEQQVGKTFFSHAAAKEGVLVKITLIDVGHTHTRIKYEDSDKTTRTLCNDGHGTCQNWEVINLALAEIEIMSFWQRETRALEKAAGIARSKHTAACAQIAELKKQQAQA